MLARPEYWENYYRGTEWDIRIKRRFSFSDRSRYYWTAPELTEAVDLLKYNLEQSGIPVSILSQFMPGQYTAVMEGRIPAVADALILDRIREVTRIYSRACGNSSH